VFLFLVLALFAMAARALPGDVVELSWLAEELGVSKPTIYRLAVAGELARYGAFRVGRQWRCSKPRALRAIHGTEPDPKETP
jgi:excisionase family DNA binding protein